MERWLKNRGVLAVVLVALTVAALGRVVTHEFLRYDDSTYVTYNPHVASGLTWQNLRWAFTSGYASNWHPLTWVSHMLDVQLFGMRPSWHHLMSLALHVTNALLLWVLLRRLTGEEWPSFLVALLFAVHPLHVESVAWVAERKDVLSALFFFMSLLAYVRWRNEPGSQRHYWIALVWFALGLMSKPMLVTLPFVLLLLDFWPLRRAAELRAVPRLIWEKWPFFALCVVSSVVTYLAQERGRAVVVDLPLTERLANAFVAYSQYLRKTLWPSDLGVFYPHASLIYAGGWPLWRVGAAVLILALVTGLALWCRKRAPWVITGWLWFVGMLVPVIGIVQVGGQAFADRYTYLPLIGLFIMAVWSIGPIRSGKLSDALGLGLAVAFAGVAHWQTGFWRDNQTVFTRALAVAPQNPVAHAQLGIELAEKGKFEEALPHFQAAVRTDKSLAEAHFGLAFSLQGLGRRDEAAQEYREALKLKPGYWLARSQYAGLVWSMGNRQEAFVQYSEALGLREDDPEALLRTGIVSQEKGNLQDAAARFRALVRLQPAHGEALARLGESLLGLGRVSEAELPFLKLTRLYPTNAEFRINLGGILWQKGERDRAVEQYVAAVQAAPDSPMAHYNLGFGLSAQRKFPEAIAEFREALRLKPEYPEALAGLARALGNTGKYEAAESSFRQALQLRPDGQTRVQLATLLVRMNRPADAVANLEEGLKFQSNSVPLLVKLGWILATTPDGRVRNPKLALDYAGRVVELTGGNDVMSLAALDAAYGAAGDYAKAVESAERTRQIAERAGLTEAAEAAQKRRASYEQQRPFIESN